MTVTATQIIDSLRAGELPLPSQCKAMCRRPWVDEIRKLVQPSDWEPVRKLCDSNDEYQGEFGIALLRNILKARAEIKPYLMDLWFRPNLAFRVKIALQFTLLEFTDLSQDVMNSLRAFAFEHGQKWLDRVREFSGENGPLSYAKARLNDSGLLQSKRWIYLCCLLAVNDVDKKEAREICRHNMNFIGDEFLRETAEKILAII